MEEQFNNIINWIKNQENINGCITGSCMLGYMDGEKQDVDVFAFDETAFTKLLYLLHFNPMFQLLDPIEKWKFKDWTENPYKGSLKKLGLITIKFKYNLAIDVNIIFKEKSNNIFSVLSSFDMDIIAKGYDLRTKQYLDLSENNGMIASWNKWNPAFYKPDIWKIGRVLRQFQRVIKYHNRGYNTDLVTKKYIEILNDMLEYENIFNSLKVEEKVESVKKTSLILINIFNKWLETHSITKDELILLDQTVKIL